MLCSSCMSPLICVGTLRYKFLLSPCHKGTTGEGDSCCINWSVRATTRASDMAAGIHPVVSVYDFSVMASNAISVRENHIFYAKKGKEEDDQGKECKEGGIEAKEDTLISAAFPP
ncbi:uncharacterized protein LOC125044677 [Penaeus chinensis]|uniref:uncharacterized protein LOC125044677 n=1 Tax=Penaeus chinensis TaxID=139456 RepID=UPI001FB6E3BF|nr:uncharacterized protein LOC125044677 [Penaeus chinensis]